jgi:hypothetical protein
MLTVMDKFYTKPHVAKKCVEILMSYCKDAADYHWIEPSAGDGKFIDAMQTADLKIKGYDIDPYRDDIIKHDFLRYDVKQSDTLYGVIGNPPFGKNCKTAIQFINHAASFANLIAFILPSTFCKPNLQNKLDTRLRLVESVMLPSDSFVPRTNCKVVFQIFERDNAYTRPMTKLSRETPDFTFVKCHLQNLENDNLIWFKGYCKGYGVVVKYQTVNIKKLRRYHCIKPTHRKSTVISGLDHLRDHFIEYGTYSIGVPGISQQDICTIWKKAYP